MLYLIYWDDQTLPRYRFPREISLSSHRLIGIAQRGPQVYIKSDITQVTNIRNNGEQLCPLKSYSLKIFLNKQEKLLTAT